MSRSLKIPKVAHAHLAQKGKCWTWNQRFMRGPGIPTGVIFGHWTFLFSHRKASDANIGIIADFV